MKKNLFKLCFYFLLIIYNLIFLLYIYSINNIIKKIIYLILFFEWGLGIGDWAPAYDSTGGCGFHSGHRAVQLRILYGKPGS